VARVSHTISHHEQLRHCRTDLDPGQTKLFHQVCAPHKNGAFDRLCKRMPLAAFSSPPAFVSQSDET
jgi:hypothetical protein